jgi:hypothetical protein
MRKLIASLIVAAGLTAGAAVTIAAEEGAQAQQPTVPNFFDPSAWMGAYGTAPQGAQAGQAMPFNPANPAGWAMFIDPKTHEQAHMAFTNPAQYAQFMTPQFYMQFADPNNMMAWMNPAAYAAFMNPATYMYWMNPAAYTHMMNPAMYMQFMNPAAYNAYMNPNTYMQWMNPGAYAMPATASAGAVPFNFFDPNAWAQMVPQQPAEQAKQ